MYRLDNEEEFRSCDPEEAITAERYFNGSIPCKKPCKISMLTLKTLSMQKYSKQQLDAQVTY